MVVVEQHQFRRAVVGWTEVNWLDNVYLVGIAAPLFHGFY